MPHRDTGDLSITFHVMVHKSDNGISSVMINNDIVRSLDIDVEALYDDALKSSPDIMPARIESMMDVIMDSIEAKPDAPLPSKPFDMIVVTNDVGVDGASALFYPGVSEMIKEELGGSYYILPSSIHEMIAVPVIANSDYRDLEFMVRSINDSTVSISDRLSDRVYRYDEKSKEIEMASDFQKRMARERSCER